MLPLVIVIVVAVFVTYRKRALADIPTVGGPSAPLLSYLGTYHFIRSGVSVLQEGYDRFKGRAFKVALHNRWIVLVTGRALTDELARAPEEILSNTQAHVQLLEARHTLGTAIAADPHWLTELVLAFITKNLAALFPPAHEEMVAALEEYIPECDTEWVGVPAMDLVRRLICRTSNRILVGFPKCKDEDWLELNISRAIAIKKYIPLIGLFPTFLKGLAVRVLTPFPAQFARGKQHLEPLINERRKLLETYGKDHPDLPNDLLTWMLVHSDGSWTRSSLDALTQQMMLVQFAALQTSSVAFCHALYNLAANPQYAEPLREEVEENVRLYGWTKLGVGRMHKIDSFLKETMRSNFAGFKLLRIAIQPYTFSDGTFVPAGTAVAAPALATHQDEGLYEDAHEFRPFRFSEKRAAEGELMKLQMSATSLDYIAFGHGKHACPGRHFAANELRAMLAHIVLHYDVCTEEPGVRPPNIVIGPEVIPNQTAKLLFRRRT